MIVQCSDLESFLKNLEREAGNVFRDTVYVDRSEMPIAPEGEQAVKFEIVLQASCVIDIPDDDGQYFLQLGYSCGTDYRDASQEYDGSNTFSRMYSELNQYCDANNLFILPGVLSG